jgi:hypothetical protein
MLLIKAGIPGIILMNDSTENTSRWAVSGLKRKRKGLIKFLYIQDAKLNNKSGKDYKVVLHLLVGAPERSQSQDDERMIVLIAASQPDI